jgi:hypothetical protein
MYNLENPSPAVPVVALYRNPFRAVSNRDYKGAPLPSIFGAEAREYQKSEFALQWLRSLPHGGHLEKWDESTKKYVVIEIIEPAKAVAK